MWVWRSGHKELVSYNVPKKKTSLKSPSGGGYFAPGREHVRKIGREGGVVGGGGGRMLVTGHAVRTSMKGGGAERGATSVGNSCSRSSEGRKGGGRRGRGEV